MIVRQLRVWAALMATATVAAVITAGSAVASASTRLRSGTVHAQLASHVSAAGASAVSSGLTIKGSSIMGGIVAALAVFALAFLIVTFIRRRVTVA
jgi:hypothetical protein